MGVTVVVAVRVAWTAMTRQHRQPIRYQSQDLQNKEESELPYTLVFN